jgi:hypothetical protein
MATMDGALVKAPGSPSIYVVELGELRPIPNTETLLSHWNWEEVQTLPMIDRSAIGEPYP